MAFKPSSYQQKIFEFVEQGRGSAVVTAVAGAGKSTTLGECLARIPEEKHVLVLAFNTPIAKDFAARLEALRLREGRPFAHASARTFHSLGFRAICKRLGNSVNVDGAKCRKLARAWLGDDDYALYADFIVKLVGLAKGEGVGVLVPDTVDAWYGLVQHHDLFLDSEDADEATAVRLARELLVRSNEAAEKGSIDFDDQLYLVLRWRLKLWRHDWVLVDEAQDTNPVRRALVRLSLEPNGRLLAVGDARQAIYGFTGASHDAIDLIKRDFHAIELPLTVTYRCASAIVAAAQEFVPYLEGREDAPEGKVETLPLHREPGRNAPCALDVLGPRDAILCRQTAPLVKTAYDLIARGVGCKLLGKDIGVGLVNLVKAMRAKGLPNLEHKLHAYREREVAKYTAKGEETRAEAVADRVAALECVIDHLPETDRTIPALVRQLETMFSDSNGTLTLATVHKTKGKEFDRVAILRPDLMPSKWARQEWQLQQELNLIYVAYTRAREHLIFLAGEGV